MTKVVIESGVCGFTTEVTVEKETKKSARVTIRSECEHVRKMQEDVQALDMMAAFTDFLRNPVYRAASKHLKHAACPVPSGILKALEAELGLSLPRDARIVFVK